MTAEQIRRIFKRCGANKVRPGCEAFPGVYAELRNRLGLNIRMVELGVGHGGSGRAWLEIFGASTRLVSVDENRMLDPADVPGLLLIGDQANPKLMELAASRLEQADLIVDDASHEAQRTQASLELYWPLLRYGGAYVIEDLSYTCFWPGFGDVTESMNIVKEMLWHGLCGINRWGWEHEQAAERVNEWYNFEEMILRPGIMVLIKAKPRGASE